MKRVVKILLVFFILILVLFLLSTSVVKRTSYLNEDYYHKTIAELDSIGKSSAITNDSIEAGFSKVSITPVLDALQDDVSQGRFTRVSLAGFGDRKGKPATGIHDSIFVKAAAIRTGGKTIIMVGADLLIMPPNIIDSVEIILSHKGIKREQLFFSATHSHSSLGGWAPGFIGKEFAGDENANIQKWLINKISESVVLAINDLKPAVMGTGIFKAEDFTRNRTVGEPGTKNNDFSFIFLEQTGHRKAIIGSYSAHSTTMGDENMEVSADYPGYWARRIEAKYADIAIFFAGATGSQSPVSQGDGFNKPAYIGELLADSLGRCLGGVKLSEKIQFSCISVRINLPEYHIRLTTKLNLSTFWSKKLMPVPANVYFQALRFGNMVWITAPADFSGEYALQIKNAMAAEGFVTNVTSFNGSYTGYIMPPRYFYVRGYESQTMGWFGPDMGEYSMDIIRRLSRIVTESDEI